VLPCPVFHQQNSRTTHGMNQPPFRSSQLQNATEPSSTQRLAHTDPNSPLTPFLIGSSAIRSAPNSSVSSVESYSNRSKNACLRSHISHDLHPTNHPPYGTSHACLIATFSARSANHRSPFTPRRPLP
jgi:hypothetical protein